MNQDASVCTSPIATSNNATGLLIVGLDPGTATAKFKVPTDLITVDGSTSDASFCPVSPTSIPPETPSSAIAGDGYAYFVYYTFHEFDRLSPAAVLPYPKQAYLDLDLLYYDTANSNFGVAIGDQQALWGDLQLGAVPPDDRLLVALQAGDQFTALSIETGLPPGLGHPCSSSTTFTTQVHFLRVGTKGDSSDVVVKQWTETEQRVALPTVNYPFDHTTTRSGAMPALDWAYIITNSDQGVVVSWTIGTDNYCAQETVSNGQSACAAYVDTRFEAHLTTMTGGSIATDAAWADDRFIQPLLQLSDGSFVGNSDDGMANFDAAGNVKWDVPGYSPQMATADGSVIAQSADGSSNVTFDSNGNATGQLADFPQYQSWFGDGYNLGSVEQFAVVPVDYAATFAALAGANQSGNGTAIKENPYPRLKSCVQPNSTTMCPYDSILVGLEALQSKVSGDCVGSDSVNDCAKYVFTKIGSAGDQQIFSRFISRRAGLFDGTHSTFLMQNISGDLGSINAQQIYTRFLGTGITVADVFAKNPNLAWLAYYQPTGAQSPLGQRGLRVFVRPSTVCTDSALWNSSCQTYNQSQLFHEGLHEFYGLDDVSIQRLFGIPTITCTNDITDYIAFTVYGTTFNSCGP